MNARDFLLANPPPCQRCARVLETFNALHLMPGSHDYREGFVCESCRNTLEALYALKG